MLFKIALGCFWMILPIPMAAACMWSCLIPPIFPFGILACCVLFAVLIGATVMDLIMSCTLPLLPVLGCISLPCNMLLPPPLSCLGVCSFVCSIPLLPCIMIWLCLWI